MNKLIKIYQSLDILKQLLASGGITFVFRILGLGLNFLVVWLITHFYGESAWGDYSLAFTLAQASAVLFALGLPNALISYLGLNSIEDNFAQLLFRKGLKILLCAALVPFIIYLVGADLIATKIFHRENLAVYILILAFTVPVMIFHEFILYFFIATKKFFHFNFFMFALPNAILIILLLIARNLDGYYTLIAYMVSLLLVVLIEFTIAFKVYDKNEEIGLSAKEIVKFSSPMMFSSIMIFLLNWTDIFMLGAMVSEKEVGVYNLSYKLGSLVMLVIISMNVVLSPKIAELYNSNRLDELHKVIKKATHLIIVLTIPLCLGLILLADFILAFFGKSYTGGQNVLLIVSIGFLLNSMAGNVDQILNMTGNQKTLRNLTVIGFFVNVLLNLFLIPDYGIEGSAMASLLTNVFFNLICLFYIKKRLGFYTFI